MLDSAGMAVCIVSYLDVEGFRQSVELEAEKFVRGGGLGCEGLQTTRLRAWRVNAA